MQEIKYALFYDCHTVPDLKSVGEKFNADAFTDEVKKCGVDFLTFHARCNQGNAYYNTTSGHPHSGLKRDMFGELAQACRRKGIRLSAYFNLSLSEEELIHHREWMCVFEDGKAYHEKDGPWMRIACYNSPYREHLKNMVREVMEKYPVDGFFFDCVLKFPCICDQCMAEMKEKGINFRDKNELLAFSDFSANRLCSELTGLIRTKIPEALIFFNGRRPYRTALTEWESHHECECLPNAAWGYDYLPVMAHYLRNIVGGKTVLNMTGRFNDWGDFGSIRSQESLEFDMYYGLANGMRPDIGDHFHPSGRIIQAVFDSTRMLYRKLQSLDPWIWHAENLCDTAVIYPVPEEGLDENTALKMTVKLLDELKCQFDLLDRFEHLDRYKLLILPDNVRIPQCAIPVLERYLAGGGSIFATGTSGMTGNADEFALPSWPVKRAGDMPYNVIYFQPEGKLAADLPDMPVSLYAQALAVQCTEGAKTEMSIVAPYVNKGWDGTHTHYYTPPEKMTDYPFLVRKGQMVYCSGNLFAGFSEKASGHLKSLLKNVVNDLVPEPVVQCSGMPSFGRIFVQKKENMTLIHLLAYCPVQKGKGISVEDRIHMDDVSVAIRTNGKAVARVYCVPEKKPCPFTGQDGYCKVRVPAFDGYTLLVMEQKNM